MRTGGIFRKNGKRRTLLTEHWIKVGKDARREMQDGENFYGKGWIFIWEKKVKKSIENRINVSSNLKISSRTALS